MNTRAFGVIVAVCTQAAGSLLAQTEGTVLANANLDNCVKYAMNHQPLAMKSGIDEQIADREIKVKLADWLPQINFNGNYQNNFILPKTQFGSNYVNIGSYNSSSAQFSLNQTIFNRDVLLARISANDVITQYRQLTVNNKIEVAAAVSRAYYDVLFAQKQLDLINEDIVLLQRNLDNAYNQYKGGLVDKTDYKRATISINNALARKKAVAEQITSKYAVLKQLMSYPADKSLSLYYDSTELANDVIGLDTSQQIDYGRRIEYQLVVNQKRLLEANLKYYKWGYLPSVSAYGQYNFNYYSSKFAKLYVNNFPNSYVGLNLSFPIFQGTKRHQQVRIAQLELARNDYDARAIKDSINSQFTQSLSAYKANLANYFLQKQNLELAQDVFNVIQVQYKNGIKTYLDVIAANNDLFAAQINSLESAFQVLINKIDVRRSLGTLTY